MENNVTLLLQAAGVHQGLWHKAKVMEKGMTRVGFDRNNNLPILGETHTFHIIINYPIIHNLENNFIGSNFKLVVLKSSIIF